MSTTTGPYDCGQQAKPSAVPMLDGGPLSREDQRRPDDWRWFFAERAGAAEQSGLARGEAEAKQT